jgi:hypothetical protein
MWWMMGVVRLPVLAQHHHHHHHHHRQQHGWFVDHHAP